MPSSSLTTFDVFLEDLAEKVHNLGSDTLMIALVAAADAPTASDAQLSDLTEISYTYCSSRSLTVTSSSQSSGTYKLVIADKVLTATGGAVGPFRYAVLYNDTSTNDRLIGFYDYSTDLTLQDGETITLNFDDSDGIFSIS